MKAALRVGTTELTALEQRLDAALRADDSVDLRRAIFRLASRIGQLLDNGNSMKAIAALLQEGGLRIGTRTLSRYWRDAKRQARKDTLGVRSPGAHPKLPATTLVRALHAVKPPTSIGSSPATLGPYAQRRPNDAGDAHSVATSSEPTVPGHFTVRPDSETL